MWLLALESLASLIWIITLLASLMIAALGVSPGGEDVFGFALAWGIAIADGRDRPAHRRAVAPARLRPDRIARADARRVVPAAYWLLAAAAALRSETVALLRGPREERVVWDIPREQLDAEVGTRDPS